MQAEDIPITRPHFTEDREALQATLDTGWVVQGPRVKGFETLFAHLSDAPYALATSSCTGDRRSLALPLYPATTEEDQKRIIAGIVEEFRRCA